MDICDKNRKIVLLNVHCPRILNVSIFNLARICWFAILCGLLSSTVCHAAEMRLVSVLDNAEVGVEFSVGVVFDAANPNSADVLVADAILEYDSARLELVSVHVNDAANSDLFYAYSLATNAFPTSFSRIDSSTSNGYVQIVAGVPDGQGILASQTNVLLARVDFRVLALPANEVYGHTKIDLVFNDGEGIDESKIIIADGVGGNALSSVHGATITLGPLPTNVPLPSWLLAMLAVAFLVLANKSYRLTRNRVVAHIR